MLPDAEQGAATSVYVATASGLEQFSGQYVAERSCAATAAASPAWRSTRHPAQAVRLWQVFVTPRPRPRYSFAPNRLVSWIIPRLLPARWLDRLIGRNCGLVSNRRQQRTVWRSLQ